MTSTKKILLAGALAFFASGASGATTANLKDASNGEAMSLSGTVQDFDSKHSFMLRDANGTVKVDLGSSPAIVLNDGEKVTVNGNLEKGLFGSKIIATSISEDKSVGENLGEAIDVATGQDAAATATPYNIRSLPNKGTVKLIGTVDDVDSEKKFTLRDETGRIDVTIKSSAVASLHEGTHVMVIGEVHNGILGKSIDATQVAVR